MARTHPCSILMLLVSVVLLTLTGGGCAATARADVEAEVTIEQTGDDTQARILHRASLLADGRVLVTGGLGLTLIPPSLFSRDQCAIYDPAPGTFSEQFEPGNGGDPTTLALNTARSSHTQTTLNDGRVLITGGRTGAADTSAGERIATVEIFDPFTGLFTGVSPMAHARADHSATLLGDGRVLVAGGDAAGTWQVFDPQTDTWSAAFPLEHARSAHAAVLLADDSRAGDRVLLIAGFGSGAATVEVIDVAALGSTLLTSTLPAGLDDVAAVQVPDGQTILIGGQFVATGDTTDQCWWIDVDGDAITPAPVVPDRAGGISDHAAIALGRLVVVLGGEQQVDNTDTELDTIAVFDSHANEWVYSGAMNAAHDDAASVLLADGRVLVIGGGVPFLGQALPTATCELIDITCLAAGDATADCRVDLSDLLAVIGNWGCAGSGAVRGCGCTGDVTGDCSVNLDDLLAVIGNWGG